MRLALASTVLILSAVPAFANDARVERMLRQLDPDARFEQVCDLEAMKRIGKDKTYRPERSIVSALEVPKVVDSTMSGSGGAFKSKGQWYQFSFKCQTTADHMKVQAFQLPDRRADPAGEVGAARAVVRRLGLCDHEAWVESKCARRDDLHLPHARMRRI